MSEFPARAALLTEIESRQDELLRQLDELEKKITRVLADYAASCQTNKSGGSASHPAVAAKAPVIPAADKQMAPRAA